MNLFSYVSTTINHLNLFSSVFLEHSILNFYAVFRKVQLIPGREAILFLEYNSTTNHPIWNSVILLAAAASCGVLVAGSCHQPSRVIPIWPPWVSYGRISKIPWSIIILAMAHVWHVSVSIESEDWIHLVLLSVQGDCWSMCKQEMVSCYVWLRRRIPPSTVYTEGIGAASRWLKACIIPANGLYVWLVDSDPVLHPVTETLEADLGIRGVVFSAIEVIS